MFPYYNFNKKMQVKCKKLKKNKVSVLATIYLFTMSKETFKFFSNIAYHLWSDESSILETVNV